MLNNFKAWWLTKIEQWTNEINNDRLIEVLKETLETPEEENQL